MRRLTFGWLLFLCLIASEKAFTQDSLHCIPLWRSRLLHEDALQKKNLDKIVNNQDEIIDSLKSANKATYEFLSTQLLDEKEKFEDQKEITADFVRLADSWRDQSDYYQKKYKKQRRQKGLLTAVTVGLIILIIAK